MAKTSKRVTKRVVRPAAGVASAPSELAAAIRRPTLARKLELLREVGILDDKGKLAKKYRSWGTRVSRTTGG
jgi:hypothetical protein